MTSFENITLQAHATEWWVEITSSSNYDAATRTYGPQPFETVEEVKAFVALLPKSCKARGVPCSGVRPGRSVGHFTFHAKIATDGVNGGRNETGIKRYRALLEALAALGVTVEWTTPYRNSLTEADFESRVA